MKTPEPSPRPSLETLLRLKRSERPDSDFWDEFDRGMKQKQLAAIMEPKPWWLEYSLFARKFAPLGGMGLAGGAALFALVALRTELSLGSSSGSIAEATEQSSQAPRFAVAVVQVPDRATTQSAAVSLAKADAVPARASSPSFAMVSAGPETAAAGRIKNASTAAVSLAQVDPLPEVTALGAVKLSASSEGDANVSLDAVSAALSVPSVSTGTEGQFAYSMPEIDVLGGIVSETSVAPATVSEKEMASLANPRQARLLAMVADADATSDSLSLARVRDRVIHRMSDGEALYASVSRLGVNGDRLSVKF